ncbi:ABC transporter permease [Hymenobacter guriensis]|uniref:ABC transporter permease n=1 Tax=Hymenobacter guriensis TaxID=2793065 RepID=A0ABS0KY14_9BACT|nr:ABC transporter permease [Hymenobacter guriensis]MBG8552772.1 ABC transporter permease [Hymenobacter guriensis]
MHRPWYRWIALGWLALIVLAAASASWLPLPFQPGQTDTASIATAPSAATQHWLGTDALGRDVLAELLYGSRTLVGVSLPATALLTLLAVLLGATAGYWGNTRLRLTRAQWLGGSYATLLTALYLLLPRTGGATMMAWLLWLLIGGALAWGLGRTGWGRAREAVPLDSWILGIAAILGSVPRLILLVILAAVMPFSVVSAILMLGMLFWPGMMRLVRAEMLRMKALPYLEAARALGLTDTQIMWRHAWPALRGLVATSSLLYLTVVIGLETTLSFLGIGLPAEQASWGHLLAAARLAPEAWWVAAFPGVSLLLTLLSLRVVARKKII